MTGLGNFSNKVEEIERFGSSCTTFSISIKAKRQAATNRAIPTASDCSDEHHPKEVSSVDLEHDVHQAAKNTTKPNASDSRDEQPTKEVSSVDLEHYVHQAAKNTAKQTA